MPEVPRAAVPADRPITASRTRWRAREASQRAAVSVVPCRQAEPSSARQILTVAARIAPSPAAASRESASQAPVTGESLHDLRVAEVVEQDLHVDAGGGILFRTRLRLSFKYDAGHAHVHQ